MQSSILRFSRGVRNVKPVIQKAAMSSSSAKMVDAIPQQLYKSVWRKSNIMYITYIVAGCVVIEIVYGGITNRIWESKNSGVRLYYMN